MDSEPKQKRVSPLVLVLIIIIVLLAAAAVVLVMGKLGGDSPAVESLEDGAVPLLGYEEGLTALDEDTLQKAVDEMHAKTAEGGIPLEYQNEAYSTDGEKVECYIANPTKGSYDIYIQIFSDVEYTNQLYLSKLIPPGKALREIQLEKKLEKGTHRVYVVYTQVEDDHATAHQQVSVTMDFVVEG